MERLRFNSCQYKKYPRRPGLFYDKPFVMRGFSFDMETYLWFAGVSRAGKLLITDNKDEALRVSAEQAGYLADKRGCTTYMPWEMEVATGYYYRHHKYIDPRRLKSSPNRLHPLTIREFLMVRLLGVTLRVDSHWAWGSQKVTKWKQFTEILHGRRLYKENATGWGKQATQKVIHGVIQPMLKRLHQTWAAHGGRKAVGKSVKDHINDE